QIMGCLVVEAIGDYELTSVRQAISDALKSASMLTTLILDIRRSTTSPSNKEVSEFGRYLKSLDQKISGCIYLTADDLRYGLSNIALVNSNMNGKGGRVRLEDS
ncbi:MAG: hypothetical protein AAF529_12860, partial [Pseudomonadota bacterium]